MLASVSQYKVTEPINSVQIVYYASNPPRLPNLVTEQTAFADLLSVQGVRVRWAMPIPECPLQLNTRNVAAVMDDTIVISRMRFPIRQREIDGLNDILGEKEGKQITMDEKGFLEGGDIIVDYPYIYVGISERTSDEGAQFLQTHFGDDWEIIPLRLKPKILHLDVVFNIISPDTILLFPEAFTDIGMSFFYPF